MIGILLILALLIVSGMIMNKGSQKPVVVVEECKIHSWIIEDGTGKYFCGNCNFVAGSYKGD